MLLLVLPAVAGPDTGWFHRSEVPALLALPALIVTILVCMFVYGAMIVNKHAETGVRIQEDRHRQVVSSGPYRFFHHPFYISVIVTQLVCPLTVGSLFTYVPTLAIVALVVWRTARADATLRAELQGYAQYA